MRIITVRYEGNCTACGKALEVGTQAMYEKRTGIFCIGCEPQDSEETRRYRIQKAKKKKEKLF